MAGLVTPQLHTATTRLVLTIKHEPSVPPENVEAAVIATFEQSPDYTLEGIAIIP